ncbi:Inner membrane ABC transporter permease protein YcjO [Roseivivax sp. THAF40]|uniref:carbohydrate ABC transporter permease n=1 Tax=unclassified Roseivivax TaxID=2639302 RepID=UPI001268377C|nr:MULTISPECIES: sugar ABC transporter permease [unclassified Roseivivax]QFS83230.1 Inner membrane ABC transporter permease protein YcjO [Roseivivax sp. THAF197b]QFT46974.1 Inner membrane ABC transporter permease protein YcjO [Roseivivax sp. THAF40]
MSTRALWAFVAPSILMMVLCIGVPLVLVFGQSMHQTRTVFETVEIERCTPGFPQPRCETATEQRAVAGPDGAPLRERVFVGGENYASIVRPDRIAEAIETADPTQLSGVEFWSALRFTLTFTLLTQPFVVALGLAVALATEATVPRLRGMVTFAALLPFVITPIIGALSVRWLFIGDGVLTAALERLTGTELALFAQGWTLEALMMLYRVWSTTPFAFIVFYAGLRTVDQSLLEAATIDGANRWQRLRYVTIPHLAPLILFVTLIGLMDGYRVYEEIVGFSAAPRVVSLQWITVEYLTPDETGNRAVGRASASAALTVAGVMVLLTPALVRFWRERRRA